MKRTLLLFSFVLTTLTLWAENVTNFETQIRAINRITDLKPLSNSVGYAAKFVLNFSQPLDHQHPDKGQFSQRVIVMHRATDRPTVIVTEGYSADYALSPNYLEELSSLFNTNVIFVEHRFFAASTPTPCNWQYMTEQNAMNDLHDIVSAFKTIYHNKWISTGISKGGQTCMEFRTFYPNDVDVSVPYVGPLCYAVEDGRHEPFLRQDGTALDRKRIHDFQTEILSRKQRLLPLSKPTASRTICTLTSPCAMSSITACWNITSHTGNGAHQLQKFQMPRPQIPSSCMNYSPYRDQTTLLPTKILHPFSIRQPMNSVITATT